MKTKSAPQGNDPAALFARNLVWQEGQAWTTYLKRGTRDALKAWRDVRAQLRNLRERVA